MGPDNPGPGMPDDKLSGWEAFCVERLGFSKQTADKFIAIAKDQRFDAHGRRIPTSWRTLYELTKLDDETFQRAIESGDIRPDMERKDALTVTQKIHRGHSDDTPPCFNRRRGETGSLLGKGLRGAVWHGR